MSPKKALNELVAALTFEGVTFRVVHDERDKLQIFRVVVSHAMLVAKAEKLKAEAAANSPAPGTPGSAGVPGEPPIVQAAKFAGKIAEKYEYTILRVMGEKVGPFDMHWPVRVEHQHLDPRSTETWIVPDEAAFRTLLPEVIAKPDTQSILTHIAEMEG